MGLCFPLRIVNCGSFICVSGDPRRKVPAIEALPSGPAARMKFMGSFRLKAGVQDMNEKVTP